MNEEIISDFVEIAFDYTLLPNDALIAATCKYHGIRKIITFDSDFESVEFIEIIDFFSSEAYVKDNIILW